METSINKKFDLQNENKIAKHGYVLFAQVGRPHGLQGAFFLKTEDRRTKWDGYKSLLLQTSEGFFETSVLKTYLSAQALVVQLQGISSREQVDALYHKKIYVHKNEINLEPDEYLVSQLKGYSIVTQIDGRLKTQGTVVGIISFGAQENLEILLADGKSTSFYPFISSFIVAIHDDKKEIEVLYVAEFFERDGETKE